MPVTELSSSENQSKEKILAAAYHCFIHFGFAATSIVMIGKYAELSRFTVHKYFKNKEAILQAVALRHGEDSMVQCEKIVAQDLPVWDKICKATEVWFAPMFRHTSDPLLFNDLRLASEKYLAEIISDHQKTIKLMYQQILENAVHCGEIDLSQLQMDAGQIADFIVTSVNGFKFSIDISKIPEYIEQLINVYRVATKAT